jgi:hypothetical protein
VKEISHKRPYILRFQSREKARIGKSIETEIRLAVARSRKRGKGVWIQGEWIQGFLLEW